MPWGNPSGCSPERSGDVERIGMVDHISIRNASDWAPGTFDGSYHIHLSVEPSKMWSGPRA
ncbi:hypothetical protein N7532_008203 [Penicillium argentinense]|uniref:Uncharacterized protein n=1 Tax=Penicillium argentinense TaxID=1131581 RepID=A0A9W9K1D8_9EURO|nr:uncharacterized protein N7532_008203 [Penicillium argentinense]KAJ5089519.1 hypothetical protein N7532_008203 [Penicillium argentinense]